MNVTNAHRTFAICLGLLAPIETGAQTPVERGREIVQTVDATSRGYGDFEARLEMEIYGKDDRVRKRSMRVSGLESADGDRTLMVLERPADLAGTSFLSVQGTDGNRAQWIFLPATRRVRRISGSQSSDRFFGSHFTYDDLTPPTLEGFEHRWIRDEKVDGALVSVVERTSSEKPGTQMLWIDEERHVLSRVDYLDGEGTIERSLRIMDYADVSGFWRATRMEMVEVDSGEKTVLLWSSMRLGVGLSERDFDPSRLGR